jgi:hypothetical protein
MVNNGYAAAGGVQALGSAAMTQPWPWMRFVVRWLGQQRVVFERTSESVKGMASPLALSYDQDFHSACHWSTSHDVRRRSAPLADNN